RVQTSRPSVLGWLAFFLLLAAIGGVICGGITGLIGGFPDTVRAAKASPNEGIKLSRKNSLVVFLVVSLSFAVLAGVIGCLFSWLVRISSLILLQGRSAFFVSINAREIEVGLQFGRIAGLTAGLIAGLNRGGSAVIKHYAL